MADLNTQNRELQVVNALNDDPVITNLLQLEIQFGKKFRSSCGQRIFGPLPDTEEADQRPPKGCEVFVGNIPRDVYEDVLLPIFSEVGVVFELRLMMEFSGLNRGFCFVSYMTVHVAEKAIVRLHGRMIGSAGICVYKSLDNCRLFIGSIPRSRTKKEISDELKKVLPGITDIIHKPQPNDRHKNRGFVFVDFASHRLALEARKKIWPCKLVLFGQHVVAEWAKPQRSSELKEQTTIFISNLPRDIGHHSILNFVTHEFENKSVVNISKMRGERHAIVEFSTARLANRALQILNGAVFQDNLIYAQWSNEPIGPGFHRHGSPQGNHSNAAVAPRFTNRRGFEAMGVNGEVPIEAPYFANNMPYVYNRQFAPENVPNDGYYQRPTTKKLYYTPNSTLQIENAPSCSGFVQNGGGSNLAVVPYNSSVNISFIRNSEHSRFNNANGVYSVTEVEAKFNGMRLDSKK